MKFLLNCQLRRQLRGCHTTFMTTVAFIGFSFVLLENVKNNQSNPSQMENIRLVLESDSNVSKELEKNEQCLGFNGALQDSIPELGVGKARYDNKRMLRIYDFHYTGNEWESLVGQYDVCFSTQASIDRMYWLPYVLERWTAPLSLAVHLTSEEEWLIFNLYMCYLSKCHAGYMNQVSIHLAVPSNITTTLKVTEETIGQWNIIDFGKEYKKLEACPEAKEYLKYLLETFPMVDKEKLKMKEVYPQNHMRNIARKACGRHWTYSADIDIIPRDGMANMLQKFYNDRKKIPCDKCAYVIPTFEMNETFPFPKSKKEVIKLFKSGAARQFHGKLYSTGHKATDYNKWTSTFIEEGPVSISHDIISKSIYLYEPFYISPDDTPPFDERVLGYGFTRNTQFKASYMAGWNFTVLTPVYSIHWGLQTGKTVFSPKKDGVGKNVRSTQTSANYKLYKKIVEEMELKKRLAIF